MGHEIAFTEKVTVRCVTCNEDVWKHEDVLARLNKNQKLWYAKLKSEDPDRVRKINREKSAKRRARAKSDPVKYEAYLAYAREHNRRSKARRNGGVSIGGL